MKGWRMKPSRSSDIARPVSHRTLLLFHATERRKAECCFARKAEAGPALEAYLERAK
jgi:hypothetical protein